MTSLSETDAVRAWLENFEDGERQSATDLVDEMLVVSRDDFFSGMNSLLDSISRTETGVPQKVALYAERPIKKVFGRVPVFFPGFRHGRAEGAGVPPIVVDARDQEVGSEGIVANLITNYCRNNNLNSFSHPGPKKMRKEQVRIVAILTDFIGSGQRILTMLESLAAVATLNSWKSYHLIRFVVLAYSGTADGIKAVRTHKLRPDVSIVIGCPTIQNSFKGRRRLEVEKICYSYPKKHPDPLGYKKSSALIVFAHGCPNNVPPILHSVRLGWRPLFHKRSTSKLSNAFFQIKDDPDLDQRTKNLLGVRNAREVLFSNDNDEWISVLKVLSAAESGLQTLEQISGRTHLQISVVSRFLSLAIDARWLSDEYRLTQLGGRELARFRRRRRKSPIVAGDTEKLYYPTQLRAP
jgi:hypothetical protein